MECQEILAKFSEFIQKNSIVSSKEGKCEITLPFIKFNEENINISIERTSTGQYILSDEGMCAIHLSMLNEKLFKKNSKLIAQLENLYHFKFQDGEIISNASEENLMEYLNHHLMAQLSIQNIEFTNQPYIRRDTFFQYKVGSYLQNEKISYLSPYPINILVGGKKTYEYTERIDFGFKKKLLLQAIGSYAEDKYLLNQRGKNKMIPYMELRHTSHLSEFILGVLINKKEDLNPDTFQLIESYSDEIFYWNKRQDLKKAIAAI